MHQIMTSTSSNDLLFPQQMILIVELYREVMFECGRIIFERGSH